MYLIRGGDDESYVDFSGRILEAAQRVARIPEVSALKLTLTTAPPPGLSVIPFRKDKISALSVYQEEDQPLEALVLLPGFTGAYRVMEEFPLQYEKRWPDGQPTPGACLLTLFRQRKKIDYETFIHRWHNGHTPLSLRIHPLWNYSRCVVQAPLTDDTPPYDGIVEEHFRTASDLLNPFKFFGSPLTILYRMLEVYVDTVSFLDYRSIEPYLTVEYHLKS